MLAFEHPQRETFFQQSYTAESNVQAPYPGLDMDSFNFSESMANFHPLPFSFFENPTMFASAPAQSLKPQMTRSVSSNSNVQQYPHHSCEVAPGLVSSASSSTVGSPYSGPMHPDTLQNTGDAFSTEVLSQGLGLLPTIVNQDGYTQEFVGTGFDADMPMGHDKLNGNFVDPSLISGPRSFGEGQFSDQAMFANNLHSFSSVSPAGSPAPSPNYNTYAQTQFSPHVTPDNYTNPQMFSRRQSVTSYYSGSQPSPSSDFNGDGEKGRCPHPDCGKVFKDLKAHMLTHQAERPEKCPILTCEYNQKGFARKYDKNRHTLTHYKGTMVCGFCPGSGSAAEKSFNRADVFKRHLTSVHGVEQAPPNSRKRSPTSSTRRLSSYCQDATGKCSTCSATFSNAQDFYEHLDDCVLRVVQQEEPSEAINAQHLTSVSNDRSVQETMDRHMIKTEEMATSFDEDEDDEDEDDEDDDPSFNGRSGKGIKSSKGLSSRTVLAGGISKSTKSAKKGFTWSKGGVALVGKGRKKRKHYPPSWGMSAEKMQMKKRVLCVYDGERRLWKDDMMLHNEFEVRMPLPDGRGYVTDLDVETLNRAEALHNATEEERGPWMSEEMGQMAPGVDLNELMSLTR